MKAFNIHASFENRIANIRNKVFTTICALSLFAGINAQPGSLDNTFGTDGKVSHGLNYKSAFRSVALQPDGKIVAAGYTYDGKNVDFALARYNSDGSLDDTFGSIGLVDTDFGYGFDTIYSIIIQPDGKIVAAGSAYNGINYDFALARYNSDGSLDNTFGTGGKVLTDFVTNGNECIYSVALQSDGKIVAAGYMRITTNWDFALARYNSNGSLDNTFGTDGLVTTDWGKKWSINNDIIYSVALQSDGKIVAAGETTNTFTLARYNSNGSLDSTFGSAGKVDSYGIGAYSVAIQPDGKIVAAGDYYSEPDWWYYSVIRRFNSNGELDKAFGSGGEVYLYLEAHALSVALQGDGKIVAAGYNYNYEANYDMDFAVVRVNVDGSLDDTFGANGRVITDFGTNIYDDLAFSVVLQPDGKIVAAGYSLNGFALARYNGDAISGISQVYENNKLVVYPNPFSSRAYIQTEKPLYRATLTVINSIGQPVAQFDNLSGHTISFSRGSLTPGLYIIRLTEKNNVIAKSKILITE